MALERRLLAVQGYLELGMEEEALRELNALSAEEQLCQEVLQVRLFIAMQARHWPDALQICQTLRSHFPDLPIGFMHGAFCLHEMGRTAEAKTLLVSGPEELRQEATYHYNLGCYEAILGNADAATQALCRSFEMDDKFREIAKYDPDLKSVIDTLPC